MELARDRLRRWRTGRELSWREAGELIGCDGSLIGHIEAGRRMPGRRIANAIADVTADWSDGAIESVDWDRDEDIAAGDAA